MLKRACFFSIFILYLAVNVNAQMSISLGVGGEVDQYSRHFLGAGFAGSMSYRISEMWGLGARFVYAADLGTDDDDSGSVSAMEMTANIRWYFLRFRNLLSYYFMWQQKYHWFVQFDMGGAFGYTSLKPNLASPGFMVGGTAGLHISFEKAFVEPYIRYSTTGGVGGGVIFGLTLRNTIEG
jgi:hypothetical protein